MITTQSIQNAVNGAMFGQAALNTFSNTLDFAQTHIPSNMSDNYVPYGGAGGAFSNFNDDNATSNYDQSGSGVDNFSSNDPKDFSGQFDGNSNAQTSTDNGTLIDNGASYSSIMSGDYLGAAESNSDNSANYGDCSQKSISASDTVNNEAANSNNGLPETYQNDVPTSSTVESTNTYTRSEPATLTGGDFSDDNFGRNTQDSSIGNSSTNPINPPYNSSSIVNDSSTQIITKNGRRIRLNPNTAKIGQNVVYFCTGSSKSDHYNPKDNGKIVEIGISYFYQTINTYAIVKRDDGSYYQKMFLISVYYKRLTYNFK